MTTLEPDPRPWLHRARIISASNRHAEMIVRRIREAPDTLTVEHWTAVIEAARERRLLLVDAGTDETPGEASTAGGLEVPTKDTAKATS